MNTFLWFLLFASALFIGYVYAGYPLLIILLARMRRSQPDYAETCPQVTMLIPAYNEEKYIAEKLKNTLALDYPRDRLQVLVAADGSTDKTCELVASFAPAGVELSYIPDRNGKMAAIIRAMQSVRGEIVVFSDANNMYEARAIRELVLPFADARVGATTGAKLIIDDGRDLSAAEGLYWKYESLIKTSESKLHSCVSAVGEMLAIRRSAFIPPREKIINDDHYIILDLLRRGYRVIYTPRARSFEYVSLTARDEVERRTRMNAGLYQTIAMSGRLLPRNPLLVWQVVSHKYFRAFVPFALAFLLLSNIMLVLPPFTAATLLQPWALPLLAGQFIFYALAGLGNIFKARGVLGKILYLPVFLVNSNWATLLGFIHFLSNKQSHIWRRVQR